MFKVYDRKGVEVPVSAKSLTFAEKDIRVGLDTVTDRHSGVSLEVSTVFLRGIAHGFDIAGAPFLFETMVFDPTGESVFLARYISESAASAGHAHVCSVIASDGLDSDLINEGLHSD